MPSCSWWSACLDGPLPASSCESPSLAQTALQLPPIGLGSKTSTPDWPCWSACLDGPLPASSCESVKVKDGTRMILLLLHGGEGCKKLSTKYIYTRIGGGC